MDQLAGTIILLPILTGIALIAVSRRVKAITAHWITLIAAGLTALCGALLLPYAQDSAVFAISWFPNTGPMGITTGASGLYAVAATGGGLSLILLSTANQHTGFHPLSGALMLMTLSAANVALLTDHFLARYVALEIVVLAVALAPLITRRDRATAQAIWESYLLLRIGDAGLLAAIPLLNAASGTLSITPALAAGQSLKGPALGWIICGMALAGWVKLGGLPFHRWSRPGNRLSLPIQAWLYATVIPNLGAYLLYRVTPLLSLDTIAGTIILWLAAVGALLAAYGLIYTRPQDGLTYVGAAYAGVLLAAAASGSKAAVWFGMLALTPIRLLFFVTQAPMTKSSTRPGRSAAAAMFGLSGLALTTYGMLATWWMQEAHAPPGVRVMAQTAIGLIGIWVGRLVWRGLGLRGSSSLTHDRQEPRRSFGLLWWIVMGVLSGVLLSGGVASARLFGPLLESAHIHPQPMPSGLELLRHAVLTPALPLAVILVVGTQWVRRHVPTSRPQPTAPPKYKIMYRIRTLCHTLGQKIKSIQPVMIVGRFRRLNEAMERIGPKNVNYIAQKVIASARMIEQDGLERLLHRIPQTIRRMSNVLQHWHTGKLRHNLIWAPILLTIAVLALTLWGS